MLTEVTMVTLSSGRGVDLWPLFPPLQDLCQHLHPVQEADCSGSERASVGPWCCHLATLWCGVGQWKSLVPDAVHILRPDAWCLFILHLPPHHGSRLGQSGSSVKFTHLIIHIIYLNSPHRFTYPLSPHRFTYPLSPAVFQANELLLSGRKLTAQEACCKGLVSQVLWPGTFTQEVMLRIKELVTVDSLVSQYTHTHTHRH